jgi:hypothetical protein
MREFLTALALALTCCASAQNINGYEFWLDQDHGNSNLVNTAPGATIDLLESIATGDPAPGEHTIHYRLRDSDGRWSSVLTKHFTRVVGGPYEVVSGEYWFDTADSDRAPFTLGPGEVVSTTIDPDASGLELGDHRAHYRLRDNHGFWSAVLTKHFTVRLGGPYELVLLRYWSDPAEQDPSDLSEVPIDPGVQYLDIIDHVLFCNWSTTGATNVYFQLKDANGQWSSVLTDNYTIDAATAPPDQPGAISGEHMPPFGSDQTYSVAPDPGVGAFVWILPSGWTGNSNTNSIDVQVGTVNPGWQLGVYTVNGCGASDTTWLDITTGGVERSNEARALYPNPTTGLVTVLGTQANERILVYSSSGQVVQDLRPAQAPYTLDLSSEANGLYTVRILQGAQSTYHHIMVQH